MRNLAKILPLKFKLSGKLQCFNTIYGSIEMLKIVEFLKLSIKIKNCETASRLREIILPHPKPPPPLDKILLCLWNKDILTEIYKNKKYTDICFEKCFKNSVLTTVTGTFFIHLYISLERTLLYNITQN